MRTSGIKRHSDDGSLHLILPPWSPKARKCRDEIDTTITFDTGSDSLSLGGAADELHLVGHPLQGSTCAVDIAFVGIVGLTENRKTDGGYETFGSLVRLFANIEHHRRASAIGYFAGTRTEAHLTNQCAMRIAQYASDFDGSTE